MKISASLILAIFALAPLSASAASNDFNNVVTAVEQRYSMHAQHVPMMGFVSLLARTASGGAVKGMRIAEFDHLTPALDTADLQHLVSNALGSDWHPFVTSRTANGALSIIFVQPDGPAMRMLIADFQNSELNLVRLELKGHNLNLWMQDPQNHVHHH
ncbi:MAG TPA: hypothetical protein VFW25_14710 [Silvibacterium sp.]|nr:hypothetical protein [Silvibacterium sp.]